MSASRSISVLALPGAAAPGEVLVSHTVQDLVGAVDLDFARFAVTP